MVFFTLLIVWSLLGMTTTLTVCGTLKTLSHLFFECALAQSVLGWIQSLMFRALSLCPSLLCRHVLFGFSASELAVVPRVFVYLLNLAKYFLWRARNDYRFRFPLDGSY